MTITEWRRTRLDRAEKTPRIMLLNDEMLKLFKRLWFVLNVLLLLFFALFLIPHSHYLFRHHHLHRVPYPLVAMHPVLTTLT